MQKHIFLETEGDAWFARNAERLGERDLVSGVIETSGMKPKRVLEVGCADAWRLARLRRRYNCEVTGVEPSIEARAVAACRDLRVVNATAAILPFKAAKFDLVIYGFCLYLTDPADWFQIVTEGDRVLADGGHLIVHDFDMTGTPHPFARKYEHREGVLSYHVDFAKFWMAHPWYHPVDIVVAGSERVTVLRKIVSITVNA